MKYAFLLFLVAFFSCNSGSKSLKTTPDTCYTQILFKNIYAGGYPAPPAQATAIRIIFDSLHVGDEKNFHKLDTIYYVGYNFPVIDPKDSTHKAHLKSKLNPEVDSFSITYYPILPINLITDYSHTDPIRPKK